MAGLEDPRIRGVEAVAPSARMAKPPTEGSEIEQRPLSRLCQVCESIFSRSAEWYLNDLESRKAERENEEPWPCGCAFEVHSRHGDKVSWYPHHRSGTERSEAISAGCELCAQIPDRFRGNGLCYAFELVASAPERQCNLKFSSAKRWSEYGQGPSMVVRPSSKIWDVTAAARTSISTGSFETLTLAKTWLDECTRSHPECAPVEHDYYPTRLLELASSQLRLLECNSEPPAGPYATVSHCWGGETFITLTRQNYDRFRLGIDMSEFPNTFRDIFTVAQFLSIQYIWIDCFCIIQGDQGDWEHEAPRMQHVYSHAKLNIGASGARKPSDGCFYKRDPPVKVQVANEDQELHNFLSNLFQDERPDRSGENLPLFVNWALQDGPLERVVLNEHGPQLASHLRSSPIFHRAWIVQERLLASRMLHLASNKIGLTWECQGCTSHVVNEFAPVNESPGIRNKGRSMVNAFDRPGCLHESTSGTEDDRIALWRMVIFTYTRAKLTYLSDKSVAIQSVAERIARLRSTRYVLGFFIRDLPKGLCWHSDHHFDTWKARSKVPSWSWLSVDGVLELGYNYSPCPGELLAALIWPGEANDMFVVCRPFVLSRTCVREAAHKHGVWHSQNFTIRLYSDDVDFKAGQTCFICLPIAEEGIAAPYVSTVKGIIVAPQPDGAYTRIGAFQKDLSRRRERDRLEFYEKHQKTRPRIYHII